METTDGSGEADYYLLLLLFAIYTAKSGTLSLIRKRARWPLLEVARLRPL